MELDWDHVHLRSLDAEAAADYYVRVFDAKRLPSQHPGGTGLRTVVDLHGMKLFFEQVTEAMHAAPLPPYRGLEHFAFTVGNLDAVVADLKQRGAEFAVEPREGAPGVRIAFVRGPDEVRIELVDRHA